MKRRALIKKLKSGGWRIIRGGKHDLATHPEKTGKIPIPRHNEINDHTAREILKDAELL